MTTFDEALKKIGLLTGWQLIDGSGGRLTIRDEQLRCPLEALAGTGPMMLSAAAVLLEIPVEDMERLANAADDDAECPVADRHALLVACGLTGTEQGQ